MRKPKGFAHKTSVSVDRTRAEIERLVRAHGATAFGRMWGIAAASVVFEAKGRHLRFELPLPKEREFRSEDRRKAEERRRWRCLLLAIKSKFESVESGISVFDEEFLANIVMPGQSETLGERMAPQIAAAYERGAHMPPLLGAAQP